MSISVASSILFAYKLVEMVRLNGSNTKNGITGEVRVVYSIFPRTPSFGGLECAGRMEVESGVSRKISGWGWLQLAKEDTSTNGCGVLVGLLPISYYSSNICAAGRAGSCVDALARNPSRFRAHRANLCAQIVFIDKFSIIYPPKLTTPVFYEENPLPIGIYFAFYLHWEP